MIIFWILAGGLLLLALIFVLAPLRRPAPPEDSIQQDALNLEVFRQRLKELDADLQSGFLEQDRYAAARHDLERELLYDVGEAGVLEDSARGSSAIGRWLLGGSLAIAIPLTAVLVYLQLGDPVLIDRLQGGIASAQSATGDPAAGPQASLDELVLRLAKRLEKEPEDLDGWLMLGRTYFATGKPQEGLKAIEKAVALAPDRTDIKLAQAEALAAASPTKSLEGRPAELIRAVLEQEPENRVARWLAGMLSFQRGQYQSAVATWKKILAELDPAGDEAANLKEMIAEAESRAVVPQTASTSEPRPAQAEATATPTEPSPASKPATKESGAAVTVRVSLSESLLPQASAEDTVFVFARAASGPAMPLAVQRIQVKDLPKTIRLDDSMSMKPAMRLSAFSQVVLSARVSKSGEATPQPGDLYGETEAVSVADGTERSILINRIRP